MRLLSIVPEIALVPIIILMGCNGQPTTALGPSSTAFRQSNTPNPTLTIQASRIPSLTLTPLVNPNTELISVASGNPRVSGDGQYVVYLKYMNNVTQIALKDRVEQNEILISAAPDGTPGDGPSVSPSISGDGQGIAFFSFATNLEPSAKEDCSALPGGTKSCGALYVYDVPSKTLEHVAVGAAYEIGQSTAISENGDFVAFASAWSKILEGIFLYDRSSKKIIPIHQINVSNSSTSQVSASSAVDISGDGRVVAFVTSDDGVVPQDDNGVSDVFLYDHMTGQIERIGMPIDGKESGQPSGSYLSGLSNIASVSISSDARYVTFLSAVPNLVKPAPLSCNDYSGEHFPACVHVYLVDRQIQSIELVSIADNGTFGNAPSQDVSVSDDGRFITFTSFATNLTSSLPVICPTGNYCPQAYLRDRRDKRTYLISLGADQQLPNSFSTASDISAKGQYATYYSAATNLVPETPNGGSYIVNLFTLLGIQG